MEDDRELDDMLDVIEGKLFNRSTPKLGVSSLSPRKSKNSKSCSSTTGVPSSSGLENSGAVRCSDKNEMNLDEMIDDICSDICSNCSNESSKSIVSPSRNPKNTPQAQLSHGSTPKKRAEIPLDESEMNLDQMIKEICSSRTISPSRNSITNYQPLQSHRVDGTFSSKCYPVLLGGSTDDMGYSTNTSPKACNNLRCTSCNFRVIFYQDVSWHPKSDYLFFRNNVPNYARLKTNLVRKKGFRAYACQCQWLSVNSLKEVSSSPELKWVCWKHP